MHSALFSNATKSALLMFTLWVPGCVPADEPDAGADVMDAGPRIATCTASPAVSGECNDASVCVQGARTSVTCTSSIQNFAASAGPSGTGFIVASTRLESSGSLYNTHLLTIPSDGGATSFDQPTTDIDGGYYGFDLQAASQAWDTPAVFWQSDSLSPVYAAVVSDTTPGNAGEIAIPAVDGGFTGLAAGAMAPTGTLFAWGRSGAGWALATRAAGMPGTWSVATVAGSTEFPGGLAIGPDGRAYTAQWSPGTTMGSSGRLTLSVAGGAPTDVITDLFRTSPVITRIAVGHDTNGAIESVMLWDNQGVFAAVPDGAGGYAKLTVPQPGVADDCPHGAVHFTCDECHAPSCTVLGDAIYAADLAPASDGGVWLAYLMVHYDTASSVNAVPQTVSGQTVGCDCQITQTRDDTHATEVVLARVYTGASRAIDVRAHVPAPPGVRSLALSQRDGVLHLVMGNYGSTSALSVTHVAVAESDVR